MLEDAISRLYRVPPAEFTQLRTELVAAARSRGDALAAKQIEALRKPSIAAWVVNVLVHAEADATMRLADMGDKLRAAHTALDSDRIKELSSTRRKLVDELARAAFKAAGLAQPPAALRDDVTGTLHAAIANSAVNERLGRLSKAEKWSGFGDVVETTAPVLRVVPGGKAARKADATTRTPPEPGGADRLAAAKREMQTAIDTVAAAEQAKLAADDELDQRQAEFAAARIKRDEVRRRMAEAERRFEAAAQQLDRAKQSSKDAAELLKAAKTAARKRRDELTSARKH